jgi:hypothetical protein
MRRVQQQRYRARVFPPLGKLQDVLDQFCFLRYARDGLLQVESQQICEQYPIFEGYG